MREEAERIRAGTSGRTWIKNKFSSTEPVTYNGKCSIGENGFLIAEEEPRIQVGGLNLPGITINQAGTYFFNAWFEPLDLTNGDIFESGVEYIGNKKYSFGMQISDTIEPYVEFMACALSPDSQKEKILLEIVKRMPVAGTAAGKLATLSDIACKLQKGELRDAMLSAGAFIAGETLNIIDKSYPTSLSSLEKELLDLALKTNQIAGYQAFLEAILPDVRAPLSMAANDDLENISFQEFHDLCSAFVFGILGENVPEKRIISVFGADVAFLADGDGKHALSVDEIGEDLSNLGEEMTAASGRVASFILDNDKIYDLELETTLDCFIRIDDPASGGFALYVLNVEDYAKGSLEVTPAMTAPLLVDDGGDGSVDREIRPQGSSQARAGCLPDTGQTKCYNNTGELACPSPGEAFYGQDAQYPAGGRSYTKLDTGGVELSDSATRADGWIMTRDNVTGLVWAIKTDAAGIQNKDNTYSWYDPDPERNGGDAGTLDGGSCTGSACDTHSFIQAMNDKSYGGFSDWRMSTVKELSLLVNSGRNSPAIDAGWFPGTVSAEYWSSTSYLEKYAWRVDFERGVVSNDYKASDVMRIDYHVLAVRSGPQGSPAGLVANDDGTVSDPDTCLMWQHETGPETYTWEQAPAYAEALRLGGYDDWRVPDGNELQSIADYSFRDPAVDPLLAPGTEPSRYWSSTTSNHDTSRGWGVYFFNGAVFHQSKTNSYHVRAVRSIETTPAALSIDPESHDFGDVTVGASGPARIFTITNIGGGSMVLGTIGITDVDISAFAVLNDTCSGQSLSALASCSVDVVFLPDSEGHKSASLVIPSDHVYVLKDLTGQGIAGGGALAGDVDGDNFITLADLIICLKISTGMEQADIHLTADVDEDGKIGIPEAVYIAEHIAFSGE